MLLSLDDVAQRNRNAWTRLVAAGCGYTRPWTGLTPELLRSFASGEIDVLPPPYACIYPRDVLVDAAGKDVLCLASGGGQQSAVYGLLGARVSVLDLTKAQLEGDREAARHHNYRVSLVQGDMRDLSVFQDNSFDLVYQAISICFVPELREVYRQVARVLRPGGLYRVGHCNPATQLVEETSWDGVGYRVSSPYSSGDVGDADAAEFRHLFADIFNGLVEHDFLIRGVWEDPRHLVHNQVPEPGTYDHMLGVVQQYFAVLAQKRLA